MTTITNYVAKATLPIIQIAGAPTICRLWDGEGTGASEVANLDEQSGKLPIVQEENQGWIDDANQFIYLARPARWYGFGIVLNTPGDYTGVKYEYYNCATGVDDWVEFEPLYDSTEAFTKNGIVVWGELGDWCEFDIDSPNAPGYYIRISVDEVGTGGRATWFNLLRSVQLQPPLLLDPKHEISRTHRDINGESQISDNNYQSVRQLNVECRRTACNMEDMNNLRFWLENLNLLWIIEPSRSDPPDFNADAFYRNFVARLVDIQGFSYSPSKMRPDVFTLVFEVTRVRSASDATTETEGVTSWTTGDTPDAYHEWERVPDGSPPGEGDDIDVIGTEGDGGNIIPPITG